MVAFGTPAERPLELKQAMARIGIEVGVECRNEEVRQRSQQYRSIDDGPLASHESRACRRHPEQPSSSHRGEWSARFEAEVLSLMRDRTWIARGRCKRQRNSYLHCLSLLNWGFDRTLCVRINMALSLPKNGTDAGAVAFRDRLSLCVKSSTHSKARLPHEFPGIEHRI